MKEMDLCLLSLFYQDCNIFLFKLLGNRILSVVLYTDRCETWSLVLRGECKFREFENKDLRRIFGSKKLRNKLIR